MKKIVCFGPIISGLILAVEQYPPANAGAFVQRKAPYIGADAPMIALTLARWGARAHLICNALGDDDAGWSAIRALQQAGASSTLRLLKNYDTPIEVDICDRAGMRSWFVEGNQTLWDTMCAADRSAILDAQMVYLDWYARPCADEIAALANAHGAPLYLNVEYSLATPDMNAPMIARADVCQSFVEESVSEQDAIALARALLARGASRAIVTRGRHGCVGAQNGGVFVVPAPRVEVAAALGAGAAFSAGMIYATLQGWDFERALRFAVASGSYKCQFLAPPPVSTDEIERFMLNGLGH